MASHLRERAGLAASSKGASARVSQALEQETLQMEERLQQLKATMRQERSKSESIPKTDGIIWKNARAASSGKYIDKIMQDIERKESMLRQQKSDTTRSAANILTSRYQQQAQAQPSQPQAVDAQTPRYGMTPRDGQRQAANLQQQHQQSAWRLQSQPQWEQEHQQYIQYQQVQQQQQQHQHMMTKQQKLLENEQRIMRNLPNSNSRSSSAASGAIHPAMAPAPPPFAPPANTQVSLLRLAKMGSPVKGQVVYASEKPFAPASGGSLWDGDFDEEANAKAFQAARDAWKRGVPFDETKPEAAFSAASATAAASHSSAPSVAAASDVHAPPKPIVKSLWDGEFDEEANANAFKAARDAWKKGVDLVDEFSEKRAPAPAAASGKSALVAQPKFAASESLLHGSFDELGNRRAFQEARIAWLESQKREAKKDAAPARDLNMWSVFAAQSDAVPDFLNEEAYPDATEFDVQQAAAPSAVPKVKSAAAAAPTEKASCYHCYKMFFRETGSLDEPSNKQFCSNLCLEKCFASTKMMCASASCRRGFLRKDGILAKRLDGSAMPALFCCAPCSRGLARPPSAPPALTAASTALPPVSRSLAGTPLLDQDDDGSDIGSEDVDRDVGSSHARVESPTAAVLPPAEFTAAPIVEEPDD